MENIPNYVIGIAYIGLAASPLWVSTSLAGWLLRATFVLCGLHHLHFAAYLGWPEPPIWAVYMDFTAAFLAVIQIAILVKDREVMTTVRRG